MLMNENSELRSLLRLSKNFSKNIINKFIKNNIVLINNDGGVKSKRKHRGFIPSTFASILTYIKFNLSTKTAFLINIFSIITLSHIKFYIYIFSLIATYISFCIIIYILFFIIICSLIYILFIIFIIPLTTKKNASFIETGTYSLIYIL